MRCVTTGGSSPRAAHNKSHNCCARVAFVGRRLHSGAEPVVTQQGQSPTVTAGSCAASAPERRLPLTSSNSRIDCSTRSQASTPCPAEGSQKTFVFGANGDKAEARQSLAIPIPGNSSGKSKRRKLVGSEVSGAQIVRRPNCCRQRLGSRLSHPTVAVARVGPTHRGRSLRVRYGNACGGVLRLLNSSGVSPMVLLPLGFELGDRKVKSSVDSDQTVHSWLIPANVRVSG